METTDYVSYPVALALKKAGFDWECDHIYLRTNEIADKHAKTYKYEFADWKVDDKDYNKRARPQLAISAPSLWQAQKWLREKKGVLLWVYPDSQPIDEEYSEIELTGEWWWEIDGSVREGSGDTYPSYESALSAGIAAALELIEKEGE